MIQYQLEYSTDGGSTWIIFQAWAADQSEALNTVPLPDGTLLLRARARDSVDLVESVGTPISVTVANSVIQYQLEYSIDGGATWLVFQSWASDRSETLDTTTLPNGLLMLRAKARDATLAESIGPATNVTIANAASAHTFYRTLTVSAATALFSARRTMQVSAVTRVVTAGAPATVKTHPSAYAAKYLEFTAPTSVVKTVQGARIDVVMPLGPNLGAWTYTVQAGSDTGPAVASGTITCNATVDVFFYDGALANDASNPTVATLFSGDFGTYVVTLLAETTATRRLDAILTYHTDPMLPRLPKSLSTARNALKVSAQSAMDDMRNSVIVVGRRKATVTDSAKFNTNPNNPDGEFVVERVVDKRSIADPSAGNFVGAVKESIIFDSSITDNAYARYLARVFIYRYRNPRPPVSGDHTLLPVLQLSDPVYMEEARYGTVGINASDPRKSVLWVTGFKHRIDGKRATTSVQTQAFPDFPAFEPREDIDLSAFNNKPVINLQVQYTSLAGDLKTNPTLGLPYVCKEYGVVGVNPGDGELVSLYGVVPSGSTLSIPSTAHWPPVPGTVFIKPNFTAPGFQTVTTNTPQQDWILIRRGMVLPTVKIPYQLGVTSVAVHYRFEADKQALPTRQSEWYYEVSDDDVLSVGGGDRHNDTGDEIKATVTWKQGATDTRLGWVTNNPYHHFFNVDYRTSGRKLSLVWNQGDNALAAFQRGAATSYDIKYRRFGPSDASYNFKDPYNGGSPFYDPYTSELGYQVQISADFLVSGLYRISVRNVDDGTIVAWLTEPTADANTPESHYQYFAAGAGQQFAWDGVDTVGTWNARQSVEYAAQANGVFEEKQRTIGAGFYVWNRELADRRPGSLAVIAGQTDASTGEPVFGHGTFAQWYIHIECKADVATSPVRSDQLDAANNNGASSAIIYTHLPEPTKAELAVADWVSSTDFDPLDLNASSVASALNAANWGATGVEATVNNQKPTRLRFKVTQRPGVLWNGQQGTTTVKLSRLVHLRATIMDQFVTFNGANYPNSSFEDRAVVSRRLVNDTHTNKYTDDNYRKASSLKWADADPGTEWVFTPNQFTRNFRGAPNEVISFGDYLQLEELPKWDEGQRTVVGGSRARMQIAFMNYLWYLSGYVSDRSGRSVWAINRTFVDQSKICNNVAGDWPDPANPALAATSSTYRTPWVDDPMNQHRRTIITRQWADEKQNGAPWRAAQASRWGFATTSNDIGYQLLRHKWSDHDAASTTLNGTTWSSFGLSADPYTAWHANYTGTKDPDHPTLPSSYGALARQLPGGGIGSWTWETGPKWVPCITRDFHGYYLLPPMVDRYTVTRLAPTLLNGGIAGFFHYPWQNQGSTTNGYDGFAYMQVDMRTFHNELGQNEGNDPAAGEAWSSPVWDMTQAPDTANTSVVRFFPGHRVSTQEEPCKSHGVASNTLDYIRQDELVHWEDLRGMFSRGKRPTEQPIKVSPVQPYYMNPFKYELMVQDFAYHNAVYPLFRANVLSWFSMTFRSEYYWESATMFPVTAYGGEFLEAMNASKTRFLPASALARVRYDGGAYVGWKDDWTPSDKAAVAAANIGIGKVGFKNFDAFQTGGGRTLTPFESEMQVVGVGPRLPQTTDMLFHLVLVTERRSAAV